MKEKALLNGRYEICYFLCVTSPELESYKLSAEYRNKDIMENLVEETDIQGAFTFLHEATHSLVKQSSDIKGTDDYKTLETIFLTVYSQDMNEDFNRSLFNSIGRYQPTIAKRINSYNAE